MHTHSAVSRPAPPQVQDCVEVNGRAIGPALTSPPAANASHGALYYNKTRSPMGWFWGNKTLNMTSASLLLSGPSDATLRVVPQACPVRGCNALPSVTADIRRVVFWLGSVLVCVDFHPPLKLQNMPQLTPFAPTVATLQEWHSAVV